MAVQRRVELVYGFFSKPHKHWMEQMIFICQALFFVTKKMAGKRIFSNGFMRKKMYHFFVPLSEKNGTLFWNPHKYWIFLYH